MEIKRKTPGAGGDSTDQGDYQTLAEGRHSASYGQWHTVSGSARNTADGKVHLTLAIDGRTVLDTVDNDPQQLSAPGGAGLRADNTALEFREFTIAPAWPGTRERDGGVGAPRGRRPPARRRWPGPRLRSGPPRVHERRPQTAVGRSSRSRSSWWSPPWSTMITR
ncbi:hypothetical protein [Kitasatospora phosalacinea]|uniref:hypothetical protein n=1 Tax=Kitasatospora phosalacinea TaxID=2065 RepID=UPI000525A88B|nr:hypothetical protein [Kitasatospora phosalacinea]